MGLLLQSIKILQRSETAAGGNTLG